MTKVSERIKQFIASRIVWRSLLAICVIALFILIVVRPWEDDTSDIESNVALAWNKAIDRLGMEPLYPPQEDFFVGDIYIVATRSKEAPVPDYPSEVFEGKGFKIGHVDLRAKINGRDQTPRFAVTKLVATGNADSDQSNVELSNTSDANLVSLSEISFPGVSIRRKLNSGTRYNLFALGRDTSTVEDITISKAETYSVPVLDALSALGQYCADEATEKLCGDHYARKIFEFVFGRDIDAKYQGKFIFNLTIKLVSQVYLTRQIDVATGAADGVRYSVSKSSPHKGAAKNNGEDQSPGKDTTAKSDAAADVDKDPPPVPLSSEFMRYAAQNGATIANRQTFAKPLAFGFRSVSFAIDPNP
ncbi:hypothetical protein [Rhizobium mayense]|uniref:Uncharacterized protein n=1 Tax=Rhizobium mayense TaxID=1312184 RepID=A0ABT7JWS5_9HYPH|nr:hypothetical protein [Rhizobium mayense]MDL2399653.1 hypothetical protein [Rhizobium mayense]